MTTVATPFPDFLCPDARPYSRLFAYRLWQAIILICLWSIVFLPEFARTDDNIANLLPYRKVAIGFRYIDLFVIVMVFCHVVCLGCLRHRHIHFPRHLLAPGLAFLTTIAIAIAYGAQRGGSNFFFDWRGLGLGIGLFFVWSFWLQNRGDIAFAIQIFAVYAALRVAGIFVLYALGYGDNLFGIAIPVFDGPILSCIVFTGLLALSQQQAAQRVKRRLPWILLAGASCLLVLLCLRRTYWGELGIGVCILTLLQTRNRWRKFLFLVLSIALAAGILGPSLLSRVQSLDPTSDDNQFSADNADHVHDIADAWDQIQLSPWMGIGVGTSYSTWHIRRWKPESVMVHNAPLHVWLKYGLAGMLCYLWFHIALLRWLYRQTKRTDRATAFLQAGFAYVVAQFIMTLGFAPWPYSELQLTVLLSFILAASIVAARTSVAANYGTP